MTRARFVVLGKLEVLLDDVPVEIMAPQLRRFLCVMLLSPRRPISRTTLVECM